MRNGGDVIRRQSSIARGYGHFWGCLSAIGTSGIPDTSYHKEV